MKQIALTAGKTALVDDEDYDRAMTLNWHAHKSVTKNHVQWYASARIDGKTIYLHRFLLCAPEGMQVDHRDHDGLNNCRSNLRLCTQTQNNGNKRSRVGVSGFRGVCFYPPCGTWQARISISNKSKTLGFRRTPEEAARLYDMAARDHFGEFATLNFPEGA